MKKLLFVPLAIALVAVMSCGSDEPTVDVTPLSIGAKLPKAEVKMKDIVVKRLV
jgi:hypothetical protein